MVFLKTHLYLYLDKHAQDDSGFPRLEMEMSMETALHALSFGNERQEIVPVLKEF